MFRNVLVPLDGSPLAEQALAYATEIIQPDGTLTLVSVVRIPAYVAYGVSPYYGSIHETGDAADDHQTTVEAWTNETKAYLEQVAAVLKLSTPATIRIQAQVGDAAESIVELAEALDADAIVISTHGRSGLSRWLFGSVTQRVLEGAPCPVFVIPSKRVQQKTEPEKTEELKTDARPTEEIYA